MDFVKHQQQIKDLGFTVLADIYTAEEVILILNVINQADSSKSTFRKSTDLFAIRQFLKEIPEVKKLIFNSNLKSIIEHIFGNNYFLVKSIYFDKPAQSNWFVACHQDLTISVDKRVELENYGPWTVKQNQFAVQPPIEILQNIFTVRIHLDNTDKGNGALKIISSSHQKSIYRPETINWDIETETICDVPKGGVMIMKPLLLHSSSRTTNNEKRRVIHLEFSNLELPKGLEWAERLSINESQAEFDRVS
ncbi:MAG: phytanoyl-CoA dioxygenase [Daejeonella sp.]|nr:phytanoyl-CoA dioxygenase [Daejeonella sp.]